MTTEVDAQKFTARVNNGEFKKIANFSDKDHVSGDINHLSVYQDKNGNKFFVVESKGPGHHEIGVLDKDDAEYLQYLLKLEALKNPKYRQAVNIIEKYKMDQSVDYDYANNHLRDIIIPDANSTTLAMNDVDSDGIVDTLEHSEDSFDNDFDLEFAQYDFAMPEAADLA